MESAHAAIVRDPRSVCGGARSCVGCDRVPGNYTPPPKTDCPAPSENAIEDRPVVRVCAIRLFLYTDPVQATTGGIDLPGKSV